MENMERFAPLYAIAYAIMNSVWRIYALGEKTYFHVLVLYTGYFINEIENFFFHVPMEVWENSKLRGNTHPTGSCSHLNVPFSQTSTRVSITVWKHGKCCLFHKQRLPK